VSSSEKHGALDALVDLCHHRWTVPLVAAVGAAGARFAVLAVELGVARQSLRRTLDEAIALGIVEPNPGYGHPLRPEYRLTPAGVALLPACRSVVAATKSAPGLAGRKWTLPALVAVHLGAERFCAIQSTLPGATPRALSGALDDLVEAGWLRRDLVDDRPPRPRYRVTRSGSGPARAARALTAAASGNSRSRQQLSG
jgi:DNA-binding HxlR family transcriptional regulator